MHITGVCMCGERPRPCVGAEGTSHRQRTAERGCSKGESETEGEAGEPFQAASSHAEASEARSCSGQRAC